jgi:hypothetical protein|tara:strand:+ start:41 stop:802 length:762 start_codon:yes stop_codon:yes gene_type:complete
MSGRDIMIYDGYVGKECEDKLEERIVPSPNIDMNFWNNSPYRLKDKIIDKSGKWNQLEADNYTGQFHKFPETKNDMNFWKPEFDFTKFPETKGSLQYEFTKDLFNAQRPFETNKEMWELIKPITNLLKAVAFLRVTAYMNTSTTTHQLHGYHIDNECENAMTAIYHVNGNNCQDYKCGYLEFENWGDVIFDETPFRIRQHKGRLIRFPSKMRHSGVTSINGETRCMLVFNYVTNKMPTRPETQEQAVQEALSD